ncbi:MAG: hypothetical protein AB1689_11730 [Thermodesulfobacteriota bacterium]
MSLKADVQELIVAFDTRATTPPAWLAASGKFERIAGAVLRSTQKYTPPGSPGQAVNVEYALWHPTRHHQSGFTRTFSLGGNDAAGVVWDGGRVGSQYLTFLRPKPWLDKSKMLTLDAVHVEVCEKAGDTQQAILQAAQAGKSQVLAGWIAQLEERDRPSYAQALADGALDLVLDPAKPCTPTTDAPANPKTYKVCFEKADDIGSVKKPLTSWLLRSRATIDPSASTITVRARGTLVMNFGGHPVTLVVIYDQGAIGRKSVLIDVFDRRIDSYVAPDDVFVPAEDRSGAVVAIGDASASDGCSGAVAIANDAPADLRFPRGVSTVAWSFDDYHGNVAQHAQKVVVVDGAYFPPPIATGYVLTTVSSDGFPEVAYLYGTQGQGRQVQADEHVLVRSPSGRVLAADQAGRLVALADAQQRRVVRGDGRTFGDAPTQGFVVLRAGAAPLGETGRWTLSYVLTVPGGSPQQPEDVLARHDAKVELRGR